MQTIPFNDLSKQQLKIRGRIDSAIRSVLEHGQYIDGPEVKKLELKLEERLSGLECITCGNGTDALMLALLALDYPADTHVLVPSFTFAATVEAIVNAKLKPIFVDIDPTTFTVCPTSVCETIEWAKKVNVSVRAIVSVDLFGLPANYIALNEICSKFSLKLICDAAQSFGAKIDNQSVGHFGDITTTSFFPSKPLGCYGDGGAVFTADKTIAQKIRSLKSHGKGTSKYDNIYVGINSRLDTIQAAILLVKLGIFDDEIGLRQNVADTYNNNLPKILIPQVQPKAYKSVWAQYCVLADNSAMRDQLRKNLNKEDIPTAVYYKNPIHLLQPYSKYTVAPCGLHETENIAEKILALPMSPYIEAETQEFILTSLARFT